MRDDAVLRRALPLDRGLGPEWEQPIWMGIRESNSTYVLHRAEIRRDGDARFDTDAP